MYKDHYIFHLLFLFYFSKFFKTLTFNTRTFTRRMLYDNGLDRLNFKHCAKINKVWGRGNSVEFKIFTSIFIKIKYTYITSISNLTKWDFYMKITFYLTWYYILLHVLHNVTSRYHSLIIPIIPRHYIFWIMIVF